MCYSICCSCVDIYYFVNIISTSINNKSLILVKCPHYNFALILCKYQCWEPDRRILKNTGMQYRIVKEKQKYTLVLVR